MVKHPDNKNIAFCQLCDPPSTHDRTSSSTSNMRAHLAHVHHMAEFLPNPNGTESRAAKRRRTDNGIEYVERQTNNRAQPRDKSTKKIDMLIGIPNKLNSSLIPYIYQLLYFTIGMCWCKEYLPFSLLNSKYLEAIFHELNPDFVMPDRRYISDKIVPHLTQEITEKNKQLLEEASHITVTTDSWTSVATESYEAVTAHLIDKEMKLRLLFLMFSNRWIK